MKSTTKIILILGLLIALMLPGQAAHASGINDGKVVFGSNYTVKSGETLIGDLLVFGGTVTVEDGSSVSGSIVLFGGNLTVGGQVTGDLVLVGGSGLLKSTAVVNGDLTSVGGSFVQESGATINGTFNTFDSPPNLEYELPTQITPPDLSNLPGDLSNLANSYSFNPFSKFAWLFMKSLGWAALAALVLLFFEKYSRNVSRAVTNQPFIGGSLGFLTILVGVVLAVILIVTIILIPVALVGILLLAFAIAFGWIAIGLEVGNRLAASIHQEWSLPLTAALGTFVLNFVANGIGFIPCIGWLVPFIISMLGLGAVFLTRFGTQVYPQAASQSEPEPEEIKEIASGS